VERLDFAVIVFPSVERDFQLAVSLAEIHALKTVHIGGLFNPFAVLNIRL
jgi:hypothetical protein